MPVLANVVWPALYLEQGMLVWWVIPTGIIIEFLFLLWLTKAPASKAILMSLIMNLASAAVGVIAIPGIGMFWEFTAGLALYKVFNIGTFNPITITYTVIFAVFINAIVEWFTLRKVFSIPKGSRYFWWLAAINLITVLIADFAFTNG